MSSKQKPPNRVVFVLAFFPTAPEHPRQLCSDQREEQVQTLRSKFATSNARGVRVGRLVPLRASPRCGHRLQKRAPGTFLLR